MKKAHLIAAATILGFIGGPAYCSDFDSPPIKLKHRAERVSTANMPARLVCDRAAPDFLVAIDGAMSDRNIVITKEGELWQKEVFPLFSYKTDLPNNPIDKDYAKRVLELARRENFVAAKIANDEAARRSTSYLSSAFFKNMSQLIQGSTSPHSGANDAQADAYDKWMSEVESKIIAAKNTLGAYYKDLPVRFYIQGSAMDDGIALDAAQRVLCAKEPDQKLLGTIAKLGYQSRTNKPK